MKSLLSFASLKNIESRGLLVGGGLGGHFVNKGMSSSNISMSCEHNE